jgi:two-component system, sensor histidine kinase and response regulator
MTDKQVLRVAMVDDEEPLCLAVIRILNKYQVHVDDVGVDVTYDTTRFGSGEQFFEEIDRGTEFDLLLVDLKLPGISGLDILQRLREQGRGILAIMITAYATFETAVQATKLGAYDFLPKPFSPEELRYAVRKATDQLIISREARRLAEEKRQVRFNFISVLSHELKAPINAIEGYLRILQADEPPERLPMIERSLVRLDGMRKLIFDLLDLTRIESGQKQRQLVQVDVRAAAKAAIDLFASEAAGRGVSITLRAPEPVEMVADLSELEIILNNLVSNGVKYNKDGGSVTVMLERKAAAAPTAADSPDDSLDDAESGAPGSVTGRPGQVKIQVADTGIGMTPEESAKLFQEFMRIKNEETYKILGSGLGLSTVRKLARLYGGDATVKSEKGKGSVFTVTLYDAEPAAPAPGAAD